MTGIMTRLIVMTAFLLATVGIGKAAVDSNDELVIPIREPEAVTWQSLTFDSVVNSSEKTLRVSAKLNGQRFERLEFVLGDSTKVVPPVMLRDVDRPQLHTMMALTTRDPNAMRVWLITINVKFGDPAAQGSPSCTREAASNQPYKEATFTIDLRKNEFTRDLYDPCHNLLGTVVRQM